jgi:putative oxidoreductase
MGSLDYISKYEPQVYSILRLVTGFLFLWHGTQKFFAFPYAGFDIPLTFVVTTGGVIELAGGFLVMTGLFTRWAAFICSGEMAYAYWVYHSPNALLPLVNHGELAMLYCFLFLFIFTRGAGVFSLDYLIGSKKPKVS